MSRSLPEWLAYIERQHPKTIEMGLDRIRMVADAMGLARPATHVITVAGTNGKGSTVAFIEAIARAAGWRVGTYTSPHLLAYNERVRIDGHDAGDAALVSAFEAIEAARDDVPLTYFEFGTLAALWVFQRGALDLAILEVGLGGRLDAVNIVDPDVAVITTVDLDHQDWLGDDREVIGAEKAGIARAWKPLVIGEDDPPSSVLGRAYAIGASTWRASNDFFFEHVDVEHWRWRDPGFSVELPMPALQAPAQLRNAATAIAALRALGGDIDAAALRNGIRDARLAARLQKFDMDGVDVFVDVAHNPQAARELFTWLKATRGEGRTLGVFAALGDKDLTGVVAAVGEQIDAWWIAGIDDAGPRGLHVDALGARLDGSAAANASRHPDVASALLAARGHAEAGDRIVVFGSFHTAAGALRALAAGDSGLRNIAGV